MYADEGNSATLLSTKYGLSTKTVFLFNTSFTVAEYPNDGTEIIFRGVNPKNSKIEFVLVNGDERKTGSAKLSTIIKLLNNYTLFSPF